MTLNEFIKLTVLWTTGPWYFSYLHENIYCGYSLETLLMSTYNICFCGDIKNICGYPRVDVFYIEQTHVPPILSLSPKGSSWKILKDLREIVVCCKSYFFYCAITTMIYSVPNSKNGLTSLHCSYMYVGESIQTETPSEAYL